MSKLYELYSGKFGFWMTIASILGMIILGAERYFDHKYFQKEMKTFMQDATDFMDQAETFMFLQHGINERNKALKERDLQDEMDRITGDGSDNSP